MIPDPLVPAPYPDPVPARVLAETLGVSGNRVYMWNQRRRSTGFPAPVATIIRPWAPGQKRGTPLWHLPAVLAWWEDFDPNTRRGEHWASKRLARSGAPS